MERRRKVERITRAGATGSKVKQCRGIMITIVTAASLTKEVGSSTLGANRVCFHKRSGENKCSYSMPDLVGRVCTSQSIYHRHRQEEIGVVTTVGGFGHLAGNHRNRGTGGRIGEGRRLEYERNEQSNLNGEGDLIVLN